MREINLFRIEADFRVFSYLDQSTREFLKERTNGLKAFKNVFKGLVDKVKDKTSQTQEKLNLEPKMNEFEKVHKQEMNKERDRGLEL